MPKNNLQNEEEYQDQANQRDVESERIGQKEANPFQFASRVETGILKNCGRRAGEINKSAQCQNDGEDRWKNDRDENSPDRMFARPETTEIARGRGKDSGKYEEGAGVVDEAPERGLHAVGQHMNGGGPPPDAVKRYEADYASQEKQLKWVGGSDGTKEFDEALCQGGFRSR